MWFPWCRGRVMKRMMCLSSNSFYSKQLRVWVLVGVGLRLFLMPLAVHGDLLVMQFSAHFLAYHGKLMGDTLYPNQLVYPLPIYLLMAIMQFLFKPLMPYYHIGDVLDSSVLFGWFGAWYRPLYLFLLKAHYLPFDFAGAFLFTRWGNDDQSRLCMFRFWMLNPLLLFGTYMWGQFDVIPMFFTLLSLHFARQRSS